MLRRNDNARRLSFRTEWEVFRKQTGGWLRCFQAHDLCRIVAAHGLDLIFAQTERFHIGAHLPDALTELGKSGSPQSLESVTCSTPMLRTALYMSKGSTPRS